MIDFSFMDMFAKEDQAVMIFLGVAMIIVTLIFTSHERN